MYVLHRNVVTQAYSKVYGTFVDSRTLDSVREMYVVSIVHHAHMQIVHASTHPMHAGPWPCTAEELAIVHTTLI